MKINIVPNRELFADSPTAVVVDLPAVPRVGDVVMLDGNTDGVVSTVIWDLTEAPYIEVRLR